MVEHMFEEERLPEGLAEMTPGPELGQMLASVDRNRLAGYERVVLLQARARQVAYDQAEFYADITSIHEAETKVLPCEWTSDVEDIVASEIRAALTLTRRSAGYHLGLAWELTRRLPQVGESLRAGVIDLSKARSSSEKPLICPKRPPDEWPTSPWKGLHSRRQASWAPGSANWSSSLNPTPPGPATSKRSKSVG